MTTQAAAGMRETSRAGALGSGGRRKVTRCGNKWNVLGAGYFVGWRQEQSMLATNLTASHPVLTYKCIKKTGPTVILSGGEAAS